MRFLKIYIIIKCAARARILQSSPIRYKVYERLGFREDGQMDWYMYAWAQDVKTL